jgi:transcriptional regulator with XRE-family HTH domain
MCQSALAQACSEAKDAPVDDPLPQFGSNLRRVRQSRGLSQERLAHLCGLNMTHVARIERAEREPGVRTVAKLARGLDVRASVLFDGIEGDGS